MIKMSMNFNSKDLEKELKKQVCKAAEQEFKKNPARFLDDKVGEVFDGTCPICGVAKVVILKGGKGMCKKCGETMTIGVDFKLR